MTYEEDLQLFVTLLQGEADHLWAQAAHLRGMVSRWGRGTAKAVAGDSGLSESYIRQLIGTANAFPEPAERAADLSFSHHRIAAFTADPPYWRDQAVANAWSVQDLRSAIRAAKDPVAATEGARTAARRLERAVSKFVDEWSQAYGSMPVLVWQAVTKSSDVA